MRIGIDDAGIIRGLWNFSGPREARSEDDLVHFGNPDEFMTSIEVYLIVAQHSTTQNTSSKTSRLLFARFHEAMTLIGNFEANDERRARDESTKVVAGIRFARRDWDAFRDSRPWLRDDPLLFCICKQAYTPFSTLNLFALFHSNFDRIDVFNMSRSY